MRTGNGTQVVGELNGAGNTGGKTNTVVGAWHVVIHGLGDGNDLHAFLIQPYGIAQCIITTDGDQVIDTQPVEVFEQLGGQVIGLSLILVL